MNTQMTYIEFYKKTIENWRRDSPNSTAPSDLIISIAYDQYLQSLPANNAKLNNYLEAKATVENGDFSFEAMANMVNQHNKLLGYTQ